MRFVLRMARARDAVVLAAAAVLLRLHRRRRRRRSSRCGRSSRACAACSAREARALIAADVLISTNRDWTPEARATHRSRGWPRPAPTARTETIETPTMVRPADERGRSRGWSSCGRCRPAFPLYGTLDARRAARPYSHALLEGPRRAGAAGAADGARRRGGDAIVDRAGDASRSAASSPTSRAAGRRLQPRPARAHRLRRPAVDRPAGVRQPRAPRAAGAGAREPRSSRWSTALRDDFKDEFVSARSYRATRRRDRRDFERAENYLSLVGLVIVILGGIAVSSVTRVFVLQKIRSIAVLKCVGARSRQIIAVYLLQVMALGLAGSLLGVALARVGDRGDSAGARRRRRRSWPTCDYGVTWSAAAQGVGIGVLVSLLFSVVPLLQVRVVKPSLLLRDESPRGAARLDPASRRSVSCRLALVGADGLAGGVAPGRARRLRRLRRLALVLQLAGPAARRGRRAAGAIAIVPAAARRAAPVAPRQPDARHPAGGRPRRLLHRRRPVAAGEPAREFSLQIVPRTRRTCS